MDFKKSYSAFEEREEPIKNMVRINKNFIFYMLVFFLFIITFMQFIKPVLPKYTGKEKYYEIRGLKIPTLYQFTEFSDVFMVIEEKNVEENNKKGDYVVVFYKYEIPENIKNNYRENLYEFSYRPVLYNGNELYVLNSDDNLSFSYVMIGKLQIKYGVCISGPYEDVLQ